MTTTEGDIDTDGLLGGHRWDGCAFPGTWTPLGRTAEATEVATGATLATVGMAGPADIEASARAAAAAQPGWAALPYDQRAGVLRTAAALTQANFDEIVTWIMRESGSTRLKASFELAITLAALSEAAAMPSEPQGLLHPSAPGRLSMSRRVPIGVVGVISPFNFPLYLAIRAVAPALATGNAVVLKPDPRTAVCGGVVIARLFEEAGLPAGVLHVLPGDGDAGAAVCAAPEVGFVQFTGSTAAGRKVGEAASRHLKKVSLELGGKNPLIVLDDADLDAAVETATWGSMLHQGQICMSTGRVLVQSGIATEFTRRLSARIAALSAGDPMDPATSVGPIIDPGQLAKIHQLVTDTVSAGATLEAGGTYEGPFYAPTVLSGVTPDMPAFANEVFGPVALVTSFETDDEAVTLANDTEYGLAAAVVGTDLARAIAIGDRLNAGLVHVNDQTVGDDVIVPFGGTGASGNHTSIGGPANWEEFTQWRWTTIQTAPPPYRL
jgi:benzaldehyde dehydrogenase (NAD)